VVDRNSKQGREAKSWMIDVVAKSLNGEATHEDAIEAIKAYREAFPMEDEE
jgi:hypothetical protein